MRETVKSCAAVNPLVLPSQGLDDQLFPCTDTRGGFKGPVKLSIRLGFSPTLQGQAGVELRPDGADHLGRRPPGDVHSIRAICVQIQMLCTHPPLARCPISSHSIPHWKFCLFFFSFSILTKGIPGCSLENKGSSTAVERNPSKRRKRKCSPFLLSCRANRL